MKLTPVFSTTLSQLGFGGPDIGVDMRDHAITGTLPRGIITPLEGAPVGPVLGAPFRNFVPTGVPSQGFGYGVPYAPYGVYGNVPAYGVTAYGGIAPVSPYPTGGFAVASSPTAQGVPTAAGAPTTAYPPFVGVTTPTFYPGPRVAYPGTAGGTGVSMYPGYVGGYVAGYGPGGFVGFGYPGYGQEDEEMYGEGYEGEYEEEYGEEEAEVQNIPIQQESVQTVSEETQEVKEEPADRLETKEERREETEATSEVPVIEEKQREDEIDKTTQDEQTEMPAPVQPTQAEVETEIQDHSPSRSEIKEHRESQESAAQEQEVEGDGFGFSYRANLPLTMDQSFPVWQAFNQLHETQRDGLAVVDSSARLVATLNASNIKVRTPEFLLR